MPAKKSKKKTGPTRANVKKAQDNMSPLEWLKKFGTVLTQPIQRGSGSVAGTNVNALKQHRAIGNVTDNRKKSK